MTTTTRQNSARIAVESRSDLFRGASIVFAIALVSSMIGAGVSVGLSNASVSSTVTEASASIGLSDAFYLAEHFGYLTNSEVQYILGLYMVRNCALIGLILTPAAAAACSAGSLT